MHCGALRFAKLGKAAQNQCPVLYSDCCVRAQEHGLHVSVSRWGRKSRQCRIEDPHELSIRWSQAEVVQSECTFLREGARTELAAVVEEEPPPPPGGRVRHYAFAEACNTAAPRRGRSCPEKRHIKPCCQAHGERHRGLLLKVIGQLRNWLPGSTLIRQHCDLPRLSIAQSSVRSASHE